MILGFSTGSLTKGDIMEGINWCLQHHVDTIELSALREDELANLADAINFTDSVLPKIIFSVHLPSKLKSISESELVDFALSKTKKYNLVVHPDIITDFSLWRNLSNRLLIENMDNRKPIGQTVEHLNSIFEQLPEAGFCFDIAHARQIDSTMKLAIDLVKTFNNRLKQVHISHVTQTGQHESIQESDIEAYRTVTSLIGKDIPIIIESPVSKSDMYNEIESVYQSFSFSGDLLEMERCKRNPYYFMKNYTKTKS